MLTKELESLFDRLEELNPDAVVLGDLNDCIVGMCIVSGQYVLLYNGDKILDHFEQSMSPEDAYEYYIFNTENAYFGEGTPVILFEEDTLEGDE